MKLNIPEDQKNLSGVYIIRCLLTDEYYIGCAKCFMERRRIHVRDHIRDKKPRLLYSLMRNLGADNFEMSVYEIGSDRKREFEIIKELMPPLNGVFTRVVNHSHETRVKISKSNPQRKAIEQLTLSGEYMKTWDCGRDIERELGFVSSDISKVCRGLQKTAYKFKWRYPENK